MPQHGLYGFRPQGSEVQYEEVLYPANRIGGFRSCKGQGEAWRTSIEDGRPAQAGPVWVDREAPPSPRRATEWVKGWEQGVGVGIGVGVDVGTGTGVGNGVGEGAGVLVDGGAVGRGAGTAVDVGAADVAASVGVCRGTGVDVVEEPAHAATANRRAALAPHRLQKLFKPTSADQYT